MTALLGRRCRSPRPAPAPTPQSLAQQEGLRRQSLAQPQEQQEQEHLCLSGRQHQALFMQRLRSPLPLCCRTMVLGRLLLQQSLCWQRRSHCPRIRQRAPHTSLVRRPALRQGEPRTGMPWRLLSLPALDQQMLRPLLHCLYLTKHPVRS